MTITLITFKVKRKRNFCGQTTYIVKVSFFDISASINNYLEFNLGSQRSNPCPHERVGLFGERNDHWDECSSCKLSAYLKQHIFCLTYLALNGAYNWVVGI